MKPMMCLVLLTVLMATMWSTTMVSAQSDCTNVLISMAPCLDYITGNSSSPSQQCCNQLANVVRSSPDCLCQVLKGGGPQLGIDFNRTQALALPKACNVQTPPASRCNGKKRLVLGDHFQLDSFFQCLLSLTNMASPIKMVV